MPKIGPINNTCGILSIDTETTGVDFYHEPTGPFFVTTCDELGHNTYWEWKVDPLTRKIQYSRRDCLEIISKIRWAALLILHNAKFDHIALLVAMRSVGLEKEYLAAWDWAKVVDTLWAAHLLANNQAHDLTTCAMVYLDINISPYEETLYAAVDEARRMCRLKANTEMLGSWMIAKAGLSCIPSAKGKVGAYDYWLPKAIAVEQAYKLPKAGCNHKWKDWECLKCKGHHWHTVLEEYANIDPTVTLALWKVMEKRLERLGLVKIFNAYTKLLGVIPEVELQGMGYSKVRKNKLFTRFGKEAEECRKACIALADGEIEELPINGTSNALNHILFDKFKLRASKTTKTGKQSTDKAVIENWIATLSHNSKPVKFVENLIEYRRRQTGRSFMSSYDNYAVPGKVMKSLFKIHSSLNPTGTITTRFSSKSPNEQQVSKKMETCRGCKGKGGFCKWKISDCQACKNGKEGYCGDMCHKCKGEGEISLNIRECFGPHPGREWWSCDASNIELRLPAYAAGEDSMITLFEKPNEPPYFGSNHLLISHILHKKLFEECINKEGILDGRLFKKRYASTWYQWVKNGDFAVQYGAVAESGTADAAYHMSGAQAQIEKYLVEIKKYSKKWIDFADEYGYIETMPDRTVDPKRGYPLFCGRTQWGRVMPTVPLSYHIQGTAGWWMRMAMIHVHSYFNELNRKPGSKGYFIIASVHDELVFDLPKGVGSEPWKTNLPIMSKVCKLMSDRGNDLITPNGPVPTPVACEYHALHWAEGKSIQLSA